MCGLSFGSTGLRVLVFKSGISLVKTGADATQLTGLGCLPAAQGFAAASHWFAAASRVFAAASWTASRVFAEASRRLRGLRGGFADLHADGLAQVIRIRGWAAHTIRSAECS